ncbi:MAG: DUF5320 domain-containing protein [Bacteroidales bacterium]
MPGFDKTGPWGEGPMTGRRMGRCTNYGAASAKTAAPEPMEDYPEFYARRGFGMGRMSWGRGMAWGGRGMGWGRGRGFRNRPGLMY